MTKNRQLDQVGDAKSPPLSPDAKSLLATDGAARIPADGPPVAARAAPEAALARSLRAKATQQTPAASCQQNLWFSFFFDGTGNNLYVDEGTLKHSNVARLFRVHRRDSSADGVYRIYAPGVGTLFPEVGDNGGSVLGLGSGYMGEERMEWALKEFDKIMKPHLARSDNLSNKIIEVNVAVFGFSRGAALARAFVNKLLDERCSLDGQNRHVLKARAIPFRVRFMGLFDTVASVGRPLSSNTTNLAGTAASSITLILKSRLLRQGYIETLPRNLAFSQHGRAGADPAPGGATGHNAWGAKMRIPEMVEEVRHFVAAHEIRNSFPVDSVSILQKGQISKPAHFYETVYPGVHSDVGGSYRPGEGGRSDKPGERLGLIPLRHMYQHALAQGVPLLPETAWETTNKDDFDIDNTLLSRYNHYRSAIKAPASLGHVINAHMALYFAWRFRSIRRKNKGDRREAEHIARNSQAFQVEEAALESKIDSLNTENDIALRRTLFIEQRKSAQIMNSHSNPNAGLTLQKTNEELQEARKRQAVAQGKLLQAKAEMDALPKMGGLQSSIELYDKQLLEDVEVICAMLNEGPRKTVGRARSELRPHYKAMVEAYENEYLTNKGLTDSNIIAFFDNYVHDSLAGFAKDATLPSDPRVVFIGADEKYKFASHEHDDYEASAVA